MPSVPPGAPVADTVLEAYFATLSPVLLRSQIEKVLIDDDVSITLVLELAALEDPRVRVSPELRTLGHEFYRLLVRRWRQKNPDMRPTLIPGLQAFIMLHNPPAAPSESPTSRRWLTPRLRTRRSAEAPPDGVTVNLQPLADPGFDWSDAQRILHQIDAIGENANIWIHDAAERRPHHERVYGLAFQLLKAVERESFRRSTAPQPPAKDTSFASTLKVLESETKSARAEFLRSAEHSAQRVYAQGMRRGGEWLLGLCIAIGAGFAVFDVPAVTAIALPAGGIGAALSVIQRMHSGRSIVDVQTAADRLHMFGTLRPWIGGVLGMFAYGLIESGLLSSKLQLPSGTGHALAYVAVVGFLAGINERLAQDMITTSSKQIGSLAGRAPD